MAVLRLIKIQFLGNQKTLEVKPAYLKKSIGGKVIVQKGIVKRFSANAWIELNSIVGQIELYINGSQEPIFLSELISGQGVPNGAINKQARLTAPNPTHRDSLLRPVLNYELISDPARVAALKRQARLLALVDEPAETAIETA